MALVSDHFEFSGRRWGATSEHYKGPWTPRIRDIDPSFIMQNDRTNQKVATFENWKSKSGKYNAWNLSLDDKSWLEVKDDLLDPKNIIEIADDAGNKWLTLQGIFVWQAETAPEHKKYDIPTREVFYILKSFIIRKSDYEKTLSWLNAKGFGNWLPESHQFYETFIGEYPNSFAFDDLRGDYNIWRKANDKLDVPLVVTDDAYLNEFTLDCSHEGAVSVRMPSKFIVNEMQLVQKNLDGIFSDKDNKIISYTTNVFKESFPSALLIDKKALLKFLDDAGYKIFWTLLGEKQIIGGSLAGRDFKGRLDITGTYGFPDDSKLKGSMDTRFTS
ncbi:MAG TPA: hypothetical protein VHE10_02580 [Candidatus Paceibacterota bacterium]|nr:hypothetical protein [Candidatus Paceibacterota bacterium]